MAKKNKQAQDQQPTEQPITPVKPVELSEEQLGQIVGGSFQWGTGKPTPDPIFLNPDPTAVE